REGAVDPGRGDLQGVGALDEVLVAVQLRGDRPRDGRDVVQADALVRIDHHLDGVAAARGADVEVLELEPGVLDDRRQHAVQRTGLRPGILRGAGGGHRVYSYE